MELIKMSVVKSKEYKIAFNACQMSFGFVCEEREDTVYLACFEDGDAEVIRETLEEVGSKYEGTWQP